MRKGFTIAEILILTTVIAITCTTIILEVKGGSAHACGFFSNCGNDISQGSQVYESQQTEINQIALDKSQPIPHLTDSLERKNIIARIKLSNDPNKVSYIYLISYGKVMSFYTIKGKVSSVNSLLTTPQQLVDSAGNPCQKRGSGVNCYVVDSPDIDGSYGSNGDAIFFFTTDNAYVEWKGEYMLADQPLKLATQPELVRTIK